MGAPKQEIHLVEENVIAGTAAVLDRVMQSLSSSQSPVAFEPRHLRWLLSSPGGGLWGERVAETPKELAQRLGRPGDPKVIDRLKELKDLYHFNFGVERFDGKLLPEDMSRHDFQDRLHALREAGTLRKVEDGYVTAPDTDTISDPMVRPDISPPRLIQGVIDEEDYPRVLSLDGEGPTCVVGYGTPQDLSVEQQKKLDRAVDLLNEARQEVEGIATDSFVLAVRGLARD